MDRKRFIRELSKANSELDLNRVINALNKNIESNLSDGNPRGHKNMIICMEELAELTQQISKVLRKKKDSIHLLEELADTQISVYYIQQICNISNEELNKAINVKIDRLNDELDNNGSVA